MTDALLPAPASICSQEVDCKWVRRNIGGSVIRLDIARDTVSVDLNIKSARGHTSIHLTPLGQPVPIQEMEQYLQAQRQNSKANRCLQSS